MEIKNQYIKKQGKIYVLRECKTRSRIIKLLQKNKELTISDLRRKLNIGYKSVYLPVQSLKKAGFIKIEKRKHQKGTPVHISLKKQIKIKKRK